MVLGVLRRVLGRRGGGGGLVVDRVYSVSYNVSLVEVAAPQAMLNAFTSCFGGAGIPFSLLWAVGSGRVRYVVSRLFSGFKFMSAVASRDWLRYGFILKAHMNVAATEHMVSRGSLLLGRAQEWDAPAVVICQFPTGALHSVYEPPHALLARRVGFREGAGELYMPSGELVRRVYGELADASYPFLFATCVPNGDLEGCSAEMAVMSIDEYVATVIYAVNTAVSSSVARRSLPGLRVADVAVEPRAGGGGRL